jgi:predicted transcriptional regulator
VTEVCELLAERRRRHVCALLGRRAPRTLDDLASAVAAREAGSEGAVTAEHRERVKLSLYHVHLPRLAEAGVVAFDRDAGRVARGEAAAEVAATLAALGPAE